MFLLLQVISGGVSPRGKAEMSVGMAGLLKFPPAFREAAFMECMDCFAAMIAIPEVSRRLPATSMMLYKCFTSTDWHPSPSFFYAGAYPAC
jgi:hypothetical protein